MCCDCSKQECETRQSLDVLSNLSSSGSLVLAWKRYFRIPLLIPEGLYNLVKFKGFDALMFHHEHIYQIYLHFLILLRCSIISHGGGGRGRGGRRGEEGYLCPFLRMNWNSSWASIPEAPVTTILSRKLFSFGLHLYVFTFSLLSAETHKCFPFAQALASWSWLPGELPLVWAAANVEGHPRDAFAAETIACSHLNSSWFLWGKVLNTEHKLLQSSHTSVAFL